jgi:hypothetical protein
MRVVLDANVFVSALMNRQGSPRRILVGWEEDQFDVLVSEPIIAELGRVLRYPRIVRRHRQSEAAIEHFLGMLASQAVMVATTAQLHVVQNDESDNRYLECAVAGDAEYLVSGDRDLLDLGEFQGVVILPPAAFVALLESGRL